MGRHEAEAMGRHEAEAIGRQTDLVLDASLPKHKKWLVKRMCLIIISTIIPEPQIPHSDNL